jgi:2-octaprenyl-6-methoxyphenol hydroxylase
VLARLLARTALPNATPDALAGFAAERQRDRGAIIGTTDAMARVFTGPRILQPLFGLGLAALDAVAPARSLLAELMMFGRR